MLAYSAPVLYTLLVWWVSTGLILYLDKRPRASHKWSMVGASLVLMLALWGLHATRNDTSDFGLYTAFTCSILFWGWQEMAFLMGFVTGPSRAPCPPDCHGLRRFWAASRAVLYHELALLGSISVIAALVHGGSNQVALWTFVVLWIMRLSAKLNLFLGVRNRSEDFLPEHLRYLQTFFKHAWVNPLFPISVGVASVVAVLGWIDVFANQPASVMATSATFVYALLTLAILEHWLMVLPVSATALWMWIVKRGAVQA